MRIIVMLYITNGESIIFFSLNKKKNLFSKTIEWMLSFLTLGMKTN